MLMHVRIMVQGVRVQVYSLYLTDFYTLTLTLACNSGWRLGKFSGLKKVLPSRRAQGFGFISIFAQTLRPSVGIDRRTVGSTGVCMYMHLITRKGRGSLSTKLDSSAQFRMATGGLNKVLHIRTEHSEAC